MDTLSKRCADRLRVFSENHGTKLGASHAHEIFAALVGYHSNAAMRADKLCSIENLNKANVFVLTPSAVIDQRRQCLQGLPSDLPDTNALGEALAPMIGEVFRGRVFASFAHLSEALASEHLQKYEHFKPPESFGPLEKARDIFSKPLYEFNPQISHTGGETRLVVANRYYGSADVGFRPIDVAITIRLKRIAGYVGYAESRISAEYHFGNASRLAEP